MTDEDLEVIRPPHVSMRAMKVWLAARRLVRTCATIFVLVVVMCWWQRSPWVTLAIPGAALALAVAGWIGVLAFAFTRYSLRTLLAGMLVTGAQIAAGAMAHEDARVLPIGLLCVWGFAVAMLVVDHDPARHAKRWGLPPKAPPGPERPDA
ncbi:MAG: hypothetical protein L6R28_11485 [Planctomycetes bacterium]|nr:hypothetical protein [Planctomycetota bacterium]